MSTPHLPVLNSEVLSVLNLKANQHTIDCTVGAGGHAESILQQTGPNGQLLGLDADPAAIELAQTRLAPFGSRVYLINTNFERLAQVATEPPFSTEQPFGPIHAILADLGVSSMQVDQAERGFSFQQDGPLDMRFGPSAKQSAGALINHTDEVELANLIYRYGEERRSRRIARAIVQARPIHTTQALAEVVSRAVGGRRGRRIHPATRTFQAIRIAVNDELGALERFLPQAVSLLAPGGRLAVISFHSLEDRIVKHFFRQQATGASGQEETSYAPTPKHRQPRQTQFKLITKKPITATSVEVTANPRARSAKLRALEVENFT